MALNSPDEIWKTIPGFEGYEGSTHGRIRSYRLCGPNQKDKLADYPKRILRPGLGKRGYLKVSLSKAGRTQTFTVHRLILLTFVGPCPPGGQGCHKDGNRTHNHLDNLRWDMLKGNIKDRDKHGTTARGQKIARSKLTENQVKQIKDLDSQGYTSRELGELFSVSHSTILDIVHRRTWAHIL